MAAHKKKSSPTLDQPKKPKPDLVLPEALSFLKVTAKALSKGSYQQKVAAFFAPAALAEMMNGLYRECQAGNVAAMKLFAEIYGMTQKGGGVNVLVNQNNQNVNERSNRRDDGPMSFEQIARILEEEEQKRAAIPAHFQPMFIEATPDGAKPAE